MDQVEYKCNDGRYVFIFVDEEELIVTASTAEGDKIGRLEFKEIDCDSGSVLKLTWAYLDLKDPSYRFQGIGRECIKQMKQTFGLPIVAGDHDGHQQDDGSQLTGDAPGFIAKMRLDELIEQSRNSE